jgi:hypothetical protein
MGTTAEDDVASTMVRDEGPRDGGRRLLSSSRELRQAGSRPHGSGSLLPGRGGAPACATSCVWPPGRRSPKGRVGEARCRGAFPEASTPPGRKGSSRRRRARRRGAVDGARARVPRRHLLASACWPWAPRRPWKEAARAPEPPRGGWALDVAIPVVKGGRRGAGQQPASLLERIEMGAATDTRCV